MPISGWGTDPSTLPDEFQHRRLTVKQLGRGDAVGEQNALDERSRLVLEGVTGGVILETAIVDLYPPVGMGRVEESELDFTPLKETDIRPVLATENGVWVVSDAGEPIRVY